jgi:hypothetical protein
MNQKFRRWYWGAILGCLSLAYGVWRANVLLISPKLEIGPETTYVTGPFTADGRIDYSAAMHERLSDGVHPDANAAVLIDRAFGPGAIPAELRGRYFDWMGVDPLPEQGNYVITQLDWIRQRSIHLPNSGELRDAMLIEFQQAQERPWTADEFPVVNEWLQRNAGAIELIEQASHKPVYYSPLVTSTSLLEASSTNQNLREAARLLLIGAMFRLGQDDVEGAWNAILACHRLTSLVSHRAPDLIHHSSPYLEAIASVGDAALMSRNLSAEQARKCLEELSQVEPIGSVALTMDFGQRLQSLDAVLHQMSQMGNVDLNVILRRSNQMFDLIVATFGYESFAVRNQEMTRVNTELGQRIALNRQPLRIAGSMLFNSRAAISEMFADSLLSLLTHSYIHADVSQVRAQTRRDLSRLGYALVAYRAVHTKYPATLNALAPDYLSTLPVDRFVNQPLIYAPQEHGFLIYSIGANGKDDGGKSGGPGSPDDVSLEVPTKIGVGRTD